MLVLQVWQTPEDDDTLLEGEFSERLVVLGHFGKILRKSAVMSGNWVLKGGERLPCANREVMWVVPTFNYVAERLRYTCQCSLESGVSHTYRCHSCVRRRGGKRNIRRGLVSRARYCCILLQEFVSPRPLLPKEGEAKPRRG